VSFVFWFRPVCNLNARWIATTYPAEPGTFKVPHSVALVEDLGLLCVADRENERIQCFSTGLTPRALPLGTFIRQARQLGRVFAIDKLGGSLWTACGWIWPYNISALDHNLVGVTNGKFTGGKLQLFTVNLDNGESVASEPVYFARICSIHIYIAFEGTGKPAWRGGGSRRNNLRGWNRTEPHFETTHVICFVIWKRAAHPYCNFYNIFDNLMKIVVEYGNQINTFIRSELLLILGVSDASIKLLNKEINWVLWNFNIFYNWFEVLNFKLFTLTKQTDPGFYSDGFHLPDPSCRTFMSIPSSCQTVIFWALLYKWSAWEKDTTNTLKRE